MLLNLVPNAISFWIVSCSWSNHTILLLMFVAEKVLLLLVIPLTAQGYFTDISAVIWLCSGTHHDWTHKQFSFLAINMIGQNYNNIIPVFRMAMPIRDLILMTVNCWYLFPLPVMMSPPSFRQKPYSLLDKQHGLLFLSRSLEPISITELHQNSS